MGRRIVGYAKPTLYKQIKEIANKQDTSVSSIVCEAVREYSHSATNPSACADGPVDRPVSRDVRRDMDRPDTSSGRAGKPAFLAAYRWHAHGRGDLLAGGCARDGRHSPNVRARRDKPAGR